MTLTDADKEIAQKTMALLALKTIIGELEGWQNRYPSLDPHALVANAKLKLIEVEMDLQKEMDDEIYG